jgi:hypothetical protein
MLASNIFGLKTDMASIDVLAEAKNAVDMEGMPSVNDPRNRKHYAKADLISFGRGGVAGVARLVGFPG